MRIVGGQWRGRSIQGPRTASIRPTSDRLRETIFNILEHAHDDPVTGARVLDLFAGTGAMGFEALSRGAAFCLFVDQGAEARSLVRAAVDTLGCGGQARLFRRDATKLGVLEALQPFSLVFCDPPYGRGLAQRALSSALIGNWLTGEALLVVEEAADSGFAFPDGLTELDRRVHGDTMVAFGRLHAP